MLSVIVGADGYDELIAQSEYLERIHGMDEAVVDRVRQLRDQVQGTVSRLRSAKLRIESARDAIAAERQALVDARSAVQRRQSKLVEARRDREAVLSQDQRPRAEDRGLGRRNPGRNRGPARGLILLAAAGGSDPVRLGPADLARRRPGRLRLRDALGPDARGNRHRRSRRDPDSGRRRGHRRPPPVRSRKRRLRQLHLPRPRRRLQTCMPTSRRSRSAPARASPRAR